MLKFNLTISKARENYNAVMFLISERATTNFDNDGTLFSTVTLLCISPIRMSIENRNGSIYVTRRCRSVVFWCALNANEKPTKLERDEEVKVFDLDHFREQLRRFCRGQDAPPPLPEIYFTVAQKWSSPDMPLHACLISIVVTPLRASEELRTISPDIHSLSHSIHSGLLQISGPGPDCAASPLGTTSWNDISQSCRMAPMSAMV